jgi:hypothetical protein
MPKIPTFTRRTEMTTQAPTLRTGIQISPTATPAAALLPVAESVQNYFIKQRDNNEKLEAKKKYYEMKSEADRIITKYENNSDEFASVSGYNEEFGQYKKQQLSQIKNKRIKKRLQDLLDLDHSENVYKIKENSFNAFEKEDKVMYETEQNSLANEHYLATNPESKKKILNKRINSAIEYENKHLKGEAWLNETINKIKGDSELVDVEKEITNQNYSKAMELLKQSKNIDKDEFQKTFETIQKQSLEYNETNLYVNKILQGENPFIGVTPKNTTKKKVLQTMDNLLQSQAAENNLNEQQTFAYVDQVYAETGILSPTYENLFEFAYNAGSTTTFDSPADIPNEIILAVKSAEIADRTGRLNVYTNKEQERFFKNVIALKKIKGLDDFQAIRQAKEFEMKYDERIVRGANRQRNKMLDRIEDSKTFKDTKATNIGEVKSYANQLYDMYVSLGIDDFKAQEKVIEDLENSIVEIDDHAYLKRDIEAFKSIGGLEQVKPVKEYILKNRLPNENPDEYYLRHIGGGLFEMRREVDLSPVYGDDGDLLLFYPQDLSTIASQTKTEQEEKVKAKVKKLQEVKIKSKEEQKELETVISGIQGS